MSYEKTIRALSGHFERRAMSYEKTIKALSLHFEGTAKSYKKTIRALSLHFEGMAKSYEKTIRELSMHFEGRYDVSTLYICNTAKTAFCVFVQRKRSFRLAQLLVPFFESITEQVIPEDLLTVHSEIVRAGEAESDADVILRGRLTTLSPQCMQNVICKTCVKGVLDAVSRDIGTPLRLLHVIQDVLVKKRSETIEQAAPISVDEAASSIGCHPQSPPLVVTTVESTGNCGMDAATLPLVSDTVAVLGSRELVPVQQEEAVSVQQNVKEQAPVRVTSSKRQLLQE
ncbi:hypothetical protein IFM89_021549 [Coptis chinensis]|uniref:Uncharacterized protein n=1 Tax=Coptis chinensis TaxID=261450 RepID=A0A835M120_9MAGN|nr:hypothetical protein IFM89_021549 [Coptis chinensis]